MIQHRPYDQKVDVYSFGIVLWELITGMLPFQNMTAVQAAFAVVNKGVRPIIPHDCLPALGEIMTRCWDANPDVRPPFTDVVRMLESAEMEIVSTVRKARFRCCLSEPMTRDWNPKHAYEGCERKRKERCAHCIHHVTELVEVENVLYVKFSSYLRGKDYYLDNCVFCWQLCCIKLHSFSMKLKSSFLYSDTVCCGLCWNGFRWLPASCPNFYGS